jgi:Asp-tRNA(Asn)/Glu-tRNA(Gln) amidotransferase A subunit family amidase
MNRELDDMSALALRAAIASRELSAVEVVQRSLTRLQEVEPQINAFAEITADLALKAAAEAERQVLAGEPLGLLHGLPVSIKDLIAVADVPQRFGSRTQAYHVAAIDAPAVQRIKAQGGCIIGKTTTSEFGARAVGDSPLTGATRNPWNLARTAGGSSAGAAASVASGVSALALGTDGGGSVRIPAAMNQLVGLKASFGRVPIYPLAATPTLAHIGPLTRSVRDAALLLQAVAGHDARDPHSLTTAVPDFLAACEQPLGRLRIAWSATLGYARPDPEVLAIAEGAARVFRELGCEVEEVPWVLDDPEKVWTAEFYAGVGSRLHGAMLQRPEELDPYVLPLLEESLQRPLVDHQQLLFERYRVREALHTFMAGYDLLLTPTLPVVAPPVGENVPAGHAGRNAINWSYYTYPYNLSGQPAISLPAGRTLEGMPVGLQIIAPLFAEARLLSAAAAFEQARPWAPLIPQRSARP